MTDNLSSTPTTPDPDPESFLKRLEGEAENLEHDVEGLVSRGEHVAHEAEADVTSVAGDSEKVASDVAADITKLPQVAEPVVSALSDVLVPKDGFHDSREIAAAEEVGTVVSALDPSLAPVVTGIEAAISTIDSALGALRNHAATLRAAVTVAKPVTTTSPGGTTAATVTTPVNPPKTIATVPPIVRGLSS